MEEDITQSITVRNLQIVVYKGQILTMEEYMRVVTREEMERGMDKKIKRIEKGISKTQKELKDLEKLDKRRDPACEVGEKLLKKKKKK